MVFPCLALTPGLSRVSYYKQLDGKAGTRKHVWISTAKGVNRLQAQDSDWYVRKES